VAVITWGIAITCFGLVSWLPGALALLALAGWADVISAVFRNTIIQLAAPDALRAGCPACRSRWSPAARASVTWSPVRSRPPSATRCRWCPEAWPASRARCSWARLLPGFRKLRTPEQAGQQARIDDTGPAARAS
jgi:hypothetical protein